MVHSTHCHTSEHLRLSQYRLTWAKDVINAPIVYGRVACIATKIAKILQDVSVGFAIVLQIISIEVRLVACVHFQIQITGYEYM